MPDGSKIDLLLAKAEPIRNSGRLWGNHKAGVRSYYIEAILAREERSEKMKGTTLQVPRSVQKGGALGTRATISLQLWEDHGEVAVLLQSMEVHRSVWRSICQSNWMPRGGCDPVGKPALEQACWWDL